MRIDVLYFAAAREAAGVPSERIEAPEGATVGALRALLRARRPGLAPVLDHARIAVGDRFEPDARVVAGGEAVAVIPPVSGG